MVEGSSSNSTRISSEINPAASLVIKMSCAFFYCSPCIAVPIVVVILASKGEISWWWMVAGCVCLSLFVCCLICCIIDETVNVQHNGKVHVRRNWRVRKSTAVVETVQVEDLP